jgi:predicted transglutaminase-like protease
MGFHANIVKEKCLKNQKIKILTNLIAKRMLMVLKIILLNFLLPATEWKSTTITTLSSFTSLVTEKKSPR